MVLLNYLVAVGVKQVVISVGLWIVGLSHFEFKKMYLVHWSMQYLQPFAKKQQEL